MNNNSNTYKKPVSLENGQLNHNPITNPIPFMQQNPYMNNNLRNSGAFNNSH